MSIILSLLKTSERMEECYTCRPYTAVATIGPDNLSALASNRSARAVKSCSRGIGTLCLFLPPTTPAPSTPTHGNILILGPPERLMLCCCRGEGVAMRPPPMFWRPLRALESSLAVITALLLMPADAFTRGTTLPPTISQIIKSSNYQISIIP